jgi:Sulphur transport
MTVSSLLLTASTFALGFCMARVSLCAVATVRALIVHRQASGIGALAVAASAAGLLLIGCALLRGGATMLPGPAVSLQLALAGVILGLGALLNGGCYLSSVTYVGTGNFHYLLTLVGFALVALYSQGGAGKQLRDTTAFLPLLAGMAIFGVSTLLALRHWRRQRHAVPPLTWRGRWPWPFASLLCGSLAAVC